MQFKDWIVFENDDFIALNKPSGLLSIPDREGKEISLKILLKDKYGDIFTVHRLDKDTSGLIVFAKNEAAHKHLSKQFEERQTKKIYVGLVTGSLLEKSGHIDAPIAEHPAQNGTMIIHRRGKESLTDYEVLQDFGIYSWVQFQIHTGRTHQIRVHMKDIGHPIVCDLFTVTANRYWYLLSKANSSFQKPKRKSGQFSDGWRCMPFSFLLTTVRAICWS